MPVFDGVRYWLAESLPHGRRVLNSNYLDLNGGGVADSIDHATHIITNTSQFEGWRKVEDGEIDAVVVTETWIDRSIILGKAQPPQFYSANPAMVFSGIVACATDMTPPDLEVLSAGITALGGQWRTGLTRDVTHLFALGPGSDKYETAMHFQADTHMKVVLPHWFDDAVKLGVGGLPTAGYEWPEPRYLRADVGEDEVGGGGDGGGDGKKGSARKSQLSGEKKRLFQSVGWTDAPALPSSSAAATAKKDVWVGRNILLSVSLELSGGRREAVEAGIKRAGGVVVVYKKGGGDGDLEEELRKIGSADVFITRYRHGAAYLKALKADKTIGTLAWLFHVESSGVLTPPTDQLLHYPIPKRSISGFSAHKITVTNYTGESREYLKRLIMAMGAEFTPNMSGANTVVIAAYISGLKTTKALNWSIPIVNHIWLEDCFIQWKSLSVGVAKYIDFPPGTDFAMILGERGPGRIVLGDLEREDELLAGEEVGLSTPKNIDAKGTPNERKEDAKKKEKEKERKLGSGEQPVGTATSMRDAREVEDVVGFLDGDGDAIMDADDDVVGAGMSMAVDDDYNGGEEEVSPSKALTARKNAKKSWNNDPEEEEVISRSKVSKERKGERKSRGGDDEEVVEKVLPSKALKARKKAKNRDDEEEEEEFLSSKVLKERKKVRKGWEDDYEEESEEKVEKPKGRLIRRAGVRKEVEKEKTTEKMKAKEKVRDDPGASSKTRPRKVILPDPYDDSDSAVEIPVKTKGKVKSKNALGTPDLEDGSDYSVEEIYIKAKASTQDKPKPAPRPPIDDTDEGDDSDEPPVPKKSPYTSISKGKGKAVDVASPIRTPKRIVSVVLPVVGSSKQKPAPLTRTESLRIEADEASISSSSKRARPVKGGDLVPDSHSGGRRLLGGDNIALTHLPPKRSALIKATNHLHNVAMPDLMSYAQEKKRGFKGKDGDRISDRSRETSTAGNARKRPSDILSDPLISDEEAERKRKRKISTGRLNKKSTQAASDEGSEVETRPRKVTKKVRVVSGDERSDGSSSEKNKKGKSSVDKSRISKTDPTTVKLMTTQVTLSDDVTKSLSRIGIRFTMRPSECTHLLVPQLVRTEKFLCAMAVAPFILKEEWALESAAAKHLLPEEKYLLQDSKNERKYNFKLSDALQRAKAIGGRLFDKNIFYVTPKIPLDVKLLKNVVNAGGGQVLTTTPTIRILKANENRHVVSCPADASIWRPLAENGYNIYSPELLLTGALRQEIDWEDDANKVPGSF